MSTPERAVTSHAPTSRSFEIHVTPDRDVEVRERLGVEESDQVDDQDVRPRQWLSRAEGSSRPVEPLERAHPTGPVRFEDRRDQTGTIDAVPVGGPLMGPNGVEEVVAADADRAGEPLDERARQRGLAGSAVPGDTDDDRCTRRGAAGRDKVDDAVAVHRASVRGR
ncbi:hypothetical protein BACI9J_550001 [Bacillus altitudinis]|nr:hypothetical protein BACI9J_550001 [Bacillus altitudinis]